MQDRLQCTYKTVKLKKLHIKCTICHYRYGH